MPAGIPTLRLARVRRVDKLYYRIVATDNKMPRDTKFKEQVGEYHPYPDEFGRQRVVLNEKRIKYWIGEGMQVSDTVAYLLGRADILPMPPKKFKPRKLLRQGQFLEALEESGTVRMERFHNYDTWKAKEHLVNYKELITELERVKAEEEAAEAAKAEAEQSSTPEEGDDKPKE